VSRRIEPGPSPERRSKGGAMVAARRSEPLVDRWSSVTERRRAKVRG
jgi:hypothetical protein